MQERKLEVLRQIALAMLETIQEAGEQGVPAGPMYAAMMGQGMSLEVFNGIVDGLIDAGKIKRSAHVLYAVKQ